MFEPHSEETFRSYVFSRLAIPHVVVGSLLVLAVITSSQSNPWVSLSIEPLVVLGLAQLLLLWKILRTLQTISTRLDAVE